jgi:hypothetical protein
MITGKQFNEQYKDYKFVKFTNEIEKHNRFRFKTGLNFDHLEFNPVGQCRPGGIYFTDYNKRTMWLEYGGKKMHWTRNVTIPDRAQVYVENNKFKADKLILSERQLIYRMMCYVKQLFVKMV